MIATADVPRIAAFFSAFFEVKAHFENPMFAEFVLPSRFRIAFFKPVGRRPSFFRLPVLEKRRVLGSRFRISTYFTADRRKKLFLSKESKRAARRRIIPGANEAFFSLIRMGTAGRSRNRRRGTGFWWIDSRN